MKAKIRAASVFVVLGCFLNGSVVTAQSISSKPKSADVADSVKSKDLIPGLERAIRRLMTEGEVPGLQIAVIRGGKVGLDQELCGRNGGTAPS